ncbi:DUF6318 family protein [Nocardioides sp. Bht2]|uniref:DUF6318 family protein n=1 Tax=Nocardioides sp. Bht2 TaxID=3392297 RepID=UPI0039B4C7A1
MVLLRRWGVLLALVVVVGAGLVGCSDGGSDGDGQAGAVRSTTLDPTVEPTPGGSVLPAVEQVPVAPAAMATGDAVGAQAFVRYYFALVNYAQRTGDLEPLREATDARCGECQRGVRWIEKVLKKGWTITGGEHRVRGVDAPRRLGRESQYEVRFVLETSAQRIDASDGSKKGQSASRRTRLTAVTSHLPGGWQILRWEVRR